MLIPGRDGVDDKERPVPWREEGWPVDVPAWWSLGKASRFLGGDYEAVWPPQCVLIAMVPFCLSCKNCSEAAHDWVPWEDRLVSSFQQIAQ